MQRSTLLVEDHGRQVVDSLQKVLERVDPVQKILTSIASIPWALSLFSRLPSLLDLDGSR